jgi:hypothetical protein
VSPEVSDYQESGKLSELYLSALLTFLRVPIHDH